MTWPALLHEIWQDLRPYLPYGVGLLILWGLKRVAGESLPEMVAGAWKEITEFLTAKINLKSANALTVVLLALLIAYLFGSPLRDLFLPTATEHEDYFMAGVHTFNIVLFGAVAIYSIKLGRLGE